MPDIYQYYDYHKYLTDYYKDRKSRDSFFSYRFIGQKTGTDPGLIVKIFQGSRHLAVKNIQAFSGLLELSKRRAKYFELLVYYGRAKTDREVKIYFERLLNFSDLGTKKVERNQYEFYQKWHYTAIRELLNFYSFKDDYEALASMILPEITAAEAKKSVKLLEKLNLIKRTSADTYELTSKFQTTGGHWKSIAVQSFQKQTLELASQALETFDKKIRDISTVSITLDDSGLEKIRECIVKFHQDLLEISNQCGKGDKVYQVNLQVFPMSKSGGKSK